MSAPHDAAAAAAGPTPDDADQAATAASASAAATGHPSGPDHASPPSSSASVHMHLPPAVDGLSTPASSGSSSSSQTELVDANAARSSSASTVLPLAGAGAASPPPGPSNADAAPAVSAAADRDSPRLGGRAKVRSSSGQVSADPVLMDPISAAEVGLISVPVPSALPQDESRGAQTTGQLIAPVSPTAAPAAAPASSEAASSHIVYKLPGQTPSQSPSASSHPPPQLTKLASLGAMGSPRAGGPLRVMPPTGATSLGLPRASSGGGGSHSPSRRASKSKSRSKMLTRTYVSYSNLAQAEEAKHAQQEASQKGARTPRLISGKSAADLHAAGGGGGAPAKEKKLVSFLINDAASIALGHFPTNFIKTSKYTLLTFLPVNLYEQFRRLANAYFLFVVLLQTIPGVSPFPIYTSLAPLIFILAIGALNEAREDYHRHQADAVANSRPCIWLQPPTGAEEPITSAFVQVGQVVKIVQGQEFPADIILLHTSREDGTCYVNTANLDGEAAPKVRSASAATQSVYTTPEALTSVLAGRIQYEAPNASLYRFQGNVLLKDAASGVEVLHPLGDKQLLLRGSKLVNTDYIYGLVVYTGAQTKMMLNRNPARFKFSHFETQLNRCVVVCLVLNLFICLIPSFYYVGTDLRFAEFWGISWSDGTGWLLDFITMYILFSFMVPQSLYVTIELVKVGQAKFMEWDNDMGYTDPDSGEYTRCQVKASALNEEIGAVDVICTDKTGTLTSNKMELSRVSVSGSLFFENDTHREHHLSAHAQSAEHKEKFGRHRLMPDLAAVAFAQWARPVMEGAAGAGAGQLSFDTSADWEDVDPSAAAAAAGEHHDDNAADAVRLGIDHPAPSSSTARSRASHGTDGSTQVASLSKNAREFLLNILLCNGALPAWKAMEDKNKKTSPPPPPAKRGSIESGPAESTPLKQPEEGVELAALSSSGSPVSPQAASSDRTGKRLVFESQSPDEIALLQAAQRLGASLVQRAGNKLTVELSLPSSDAAASAASVLSPEPSPDSNDANAVAAAAQSNGANGSHVAAAPVVTLHYTVLAELEFASAWRRNSVIVRGPDGSIMLYTKGADTTVSQLIDQSDPHEMERLQLVMEQATEFADTGSRTLVFACRELSQEEWDAWFVVYNEAQNAFHNRDTQVEHAFSQIEKDMHLLGCSAVDDALQELVGQTVDFLLAAKLKIIVLTGDKLETAVTIARQSHLIRPSFTVLYLTSSTVRDVGRRLDKILQEIQAHIEAASQPHAQVSLDPKVHVSVVAVPEGRSKPELVHTEANSNQVVQAALGNKLGFALAIDGVALELALLQHRATFLKIFAHLETVVSYRSTPMQKALVVRLMKETGKTCLAIGDGANDVSMIQESHVGIGILGKEGAHAAMSSDFVIKRFHHLRRLIAIHGRWNFFRTCQVVMFSFYKNLAFPLPLFWFTFWSMANGTTSYDSLLITTFNTFFTSLPPFFAGLFDRDVNEATLMQSPWAFDAFKLQSPFTVRTFVYTLVTATYQSVIFYFVAYGMFMPQDVVHSDGRPGDMSVMGNMMITAVVLTTNLTMLLALSSINYINLLAMAIGFALFVGVFTFSSASYQMDLSPDGFGMGLPIFSAASSWLYFLLCAVLCLLPNAVIEVWYKLYYPAVFQTLQHIPPEMVAARQAAEVQAVRDAAAMHEAEAAAAAAAVVTAKANKRRARGNSDAHAGVEMQVMGQPSPAHSMQPAPGLVAAGAAVATASAASSPSVLAGSNPASTASSASATTAASPMDPKEAQL